MTTPSSDKPFTVFFEVQIPQDQPETAEDRYALYLGSAAACALDILRETIREPWLIGKELPCDIRLERKHDFDSLERKIGVASIAIEVFARDFRSAQEAAAHELCDDPGNEIIVRMAEADTAQEILYTPDVTGRRAHARLSEIWEALSGGPNVYFAVPATASSAPPICPQFVLLHWTQALHVSLQVDINALLRESRRMCGSGVVRQPITPIFDNHNHELGLRPFIAERAELEANSAGALTLHNFPDSNSQWYQRFVLPDHDELFHAAIGARLAAPDAQSAIVLCPGFQPMFSAIEHAKVFGASARVVLAASLHASGNIHAALRAPHLLESISTYSLAEVLPAAPAVAAPSAPRHQGMSL